MKDLHNNIDVVTVLHSVAVSATQTITDIDFSGANSIELVFDIGVDAGTGLGESHNGSSPRMWGTQSQPSPNRRW